jgi:hypothetical protein
MDLVMDQGYMMIYFPCWREKQFWHKISAQDCVSFMRGNDFSK